VKVRLVQLFAQGIRRPQEECRADAGVIGDLRVRDHAEPNAAHRPFRQADLIEPYGKLMRQMLPPLSDVELLRVTPKGLLLRGCQTDASSGTAIEYAQEWWCEPLG
jgi:hypothetical protein